MVAGSVLRHRSSGDDPRVGRQGPVDHLAGPKAWIGVIYLVAVFVGVIGGACVLALT